MQLHARTQWSCTFFIFELKRNSFHIIVSIGICEQSTSENFTEQKRSLLCTNVKSFQENYKDSHGKRVTLL